MRVLVTDGEMNKSLAVVRAIEDVTSFVGVTQHYPISPAGVSRFADVSHRVDTESPERYVDELVRVVRDGEYDQLLPVGGRTFELVSEHRDRFDVPVGDILPSREAMRVAVRKQETYDLAERQGVPAPVSMSLLDETDIDDVAETVGYPAVIKTGVETEKRFVRVVDTESQLRTAYHEYTQDHDSPPIVQEYLPGVGRGYFGLLIEGELVGGYAHRRIREYPPEGGASACAESSQDDELREYSERLLAPLEWTGVVMVEFKEAADGTPKLVEINPKFWGSLDLAIASGMNFPKALIEYTNGRRDFDFEFTPRRVHWPLSGDLTHAWRRPRSAPAVLRDLLSRDTQSNVRLDDPLPHVVEFGGTVIRRDV